MQSDLGDVDMELSEARATLLSGNVVELINATSVDSTNMKLLWEVSPGLYTTRNMNNNFFIVFWLSGEENFPCHSSHEIQIFAIPLFLSFFLPAKIRTLNFIALYSLSFSASYAEFEWQICGRFLHLCARYNF